jgi:O-antigen/teichoic acid export membrane protein
MQPEAEALPAADRPAKRRMALSSVVMRLSFLTGFITVLGVVTGPLQARALGASGRGELAAITVAGTFLPVIAGFGLEAFVARETARGKTVGEVVGSIGVLALATGLLLAPVGIPVAALLAHGRGVVHFFILFEFLLLPFSLLAQVSYYLLVGLERWTAIMFFRLIPALGNAAVIVALFVTHAMTVEAVSIAFIATSVVAVIPALPALRHVGRLRVNFSLLRSAIPFGLKTWVGTIAVLTNGRLDQLLMISLVSSRQLGLYAVAVTTASLSNQIGYSLSSPLLSRVAAGEREIVSRSLRTTLGFVVLINLMVALITPIFLPLVFGSQFGDAVPMALILLVAAVPLCATMVLSPAMVADGRPSIPAIAEGLTLLITIPGLLLVLPSSGGVGAALVSLVAYSANAAFQLRAACVTFGGRTRDFILFKRSDTAWAYGRLREMTGKLTGRRRRVA